MRDDRAISSPPPLFFFGAISPYSWFAAERIGDLIPDARWRCALAGVVFKANGRTSWGLTEDRERGIADCEQRAAEHGLGLIRWPDPWPTSDLYVARAMVHAERVGKLEQFALAAMRFEFLEGVDLGELPAVLEAAGRAGLDVGETAEAITQEDVKQELRVITDEALALGVFGVPTIVLGGDLYWGDDHLQRAADADRLQRGG
jgi:2-hydroxychromene-2-carboxylate isomerase